MPKKFTHFHLHTVHSLLDGFTKTPELIQVVKKMGMDAVAVTDHGNMAGIPELFKEAHANGIKPIAGIEAYLCEDVNVRGGGRDEKTPYYHITLIAGSIEGYRNLCKLSTLSYTEGFYHKPRVDPSMLAMYSKDVICLSGCIGGWPASYVKKGKTQEARDACATLASIFERFYIELMWTGEPDQKIVNRELMSISQKDGYKIIATGDSHYTHKEQSDDHDTLFAMGLHKQKSDPNRMRFKPEEYHVKSADEMWRTGLPERSLSNAYGLGTEIERYDLPVSGGIPTDDRDFERISELAWSGLELRIPDYARDAQGVYADRLLYELDTVRELHYESHFLVAYNICSYAREAGLQTGWGRGSSAGSLLSYCLFITHVDPVRHGLYFERFLNSSRREPPDIDLDFTDADRHLIVDYIKSTYGDDHVAHVATYGTLGPRQVIIDSAKCHGKQEEEIKRALECVPYDPTIKVQDILDNEGQSDHIKLVLGEEVIRAMQKFQNIPRHASIHAAGILIDAGNVAEDLPFLTGGKDRTLAVQYDYDTLKEMGYEKFDILGVRTLRVIRDCAAMVNVDVYNLPLTDTRTYDLLARGDTVGVFQLEGWGYQKFLKQFRPRNFKDIMMLNALYRPGPMQGGKGLDEIISRRFGRQEVRYLHFTLEPILKDTYGVMVYQEQVMGVVRTLAGWDLTKADLLRYAIGKKKIDDVKNFRADFVEDCRARGHKQEFSEKAFTEIEFFSRYGWNKAHAAAYGMVTYVTAYLKANYRKEFMTCLLNTEVGNHDKIAKLIKDINRSGISIHSPDINMSGINFVLGNAGILMGLSAIKGLGEKASGAIVEERTRSGKFSSVADFEVRMPRKVVHSGMRKLLGYAMRNLPAESDNDHLF